jgi:lipoate-protein ligase B
VLRVRELGLQDYATTWSLQKEAAAQRISGELADDTLLIVQHPPVVTMGRRTKAQHLLASPELLHSLGIALHEVERGGDVTVHEPGQLVVYPIIDLKEHKKDLHWYLRQVEEAIIVALGTLGIDTGRQSGQTGVWREGRKLASIGVHARDWVTWHGVALNVENSLNTFRHIVPCGIDQVEMTTVRRECEACGVLYPGLDATTQAVIRGFRGVFAKSAVAP